MKGSYCSTPSPYCSFQLEYLRFHKPICSLHKRNSERKWCFPHIDNALLKAPVNRSVCRTCLAFDLWKSSLWSSLLASRRLPRIETVFWQSPGKGSQSHFICMLRNSFACWGKMLTQISESRKEGSGGWDKGEVEKGVSTPITWFCNTVYVICVRAGKEVGGRNDTYLQGLRAPSQPFSLSRRLVVFCPSVSSPPESPCAQPHWVWL